MITKTWPETRARGGKGPDRCFTLVEILIVVVILGILAMIVIPYFTNSSQDALEAALASDLATAQKAIGLYTIQHNDRGPHLNAAGKLDTTNAIARLISKTDANGNISKDGTLGPYLPEWPKNPKASSSMAKTIIFGTASPAPTSGSGGWYYNTSTGQLSAIQKSVEAPKVNPRGTTPLL
ncbi:MAG: prepilin-type N-terminal cleavage/methylation domain-containing protein [Planctomycetaceae bacterium]|nr:prepilin-type N-terminal cleavage/methylation domain-containing protein [Planctomycetaceae bacterium]